LDNFFDNQLSIKNDESTKYHQHKKQIESVKHAGAQEEGS